MSQTLTVETAVSKCAGGKLATGFVITDISVGRLGFRNPKAGE